MTVQPELDLEHGFMAGVPSLVKSRYEIEINPTVCLALNCKADSIPYKAYAHKYRSKESGIAKSGRVAFTISLDETRDEKFDVLKNLQSRRTFYADDDERLAVMRKCLVNASRIAVANGLLRLPKGYTMEDLRALKGFRWSWKAGCSMCPCSPAFTCPLWFGKNNEIGANWFEFCFTASDVNVVYDFARTMPPAISLPPTPLIID